MIASLIQERIWRTVRAGEEAAMAWTHWIGFLSQTVRLDGPILCHPVFHHAGRGISAADLWMQHSVPSNPVVCVGVSFLQSLCWVVALSPCCSSSPCLEGNSPLPLLHLETLWEPWNTKAFGHLSNGEFCLQNSWSIFEIWPLCECVLKEGKLIQNSALLEFSDEDTSLDVSTTDNSYWTVCGAHTEEDLAQPSLNLPWMEHPCLLIAGALLIKGKSLFLWLAVWTVSCNVNSDHRSSL